MDFGNDFTESYDEKSRKYVDDLDFQKLAEIRSKWRLKMEDGK